MHTMMIRMTIDPHFMTEVTRHFTDDVAPWARSRPGFVSGQWLVHEGQRSAAGVVVFDSCDAADTAAEQARGAGQSPDSPWSIVDVMVLEQIAVA
jgi:hypothetical protein